MGKLVVNEENDEENDGARGKLDDKSTEGMKLPKEPRLGMLNGTPATLPFLLLLLLVMLWLLRLLMLLRSTLPATTGTPLSVLVVSFFFFLGAHCCGQYLNPRSLSRRWLRWIRPVLLLYRMGKYNFRCNSSFV